MSDFPHSPWSHFRFTEIHENDLLPEVYDTGLLEPATLLQVVKFNRLGGSPDASDFFFTTLPRRVMTEEELVSCQCFSLLRITLCKH